MIELGPLEAITCIHEVFVNYPVSESAPKCFIGDIQVVWKREEEPIDDQWITSSVPIPSTHLFNKSLVICVSKIFELK